MASASHGFWQARFASLRSIIWSKANKSPPRPASPAPPLNSSGLPTPTPSPSSPIAPIQASSPISSSLISTAALPFASASSTATSTRRHSRPTARASRSSMLKAPRVRPVHSPPKLRPPASSEPTTSRFSASPRFPLRLPNPLLEPPPLQLLSLRPTFTSSSSTGRRIQNRSPTSPPTLPAKTTGGSPNSTHSPSPRPKAPNPPPSLLPLTSPARSAASRSPNPVGRPTANPSPSSAVS